MTEAEEDKLLALKDFMLKSNKAKANMGEQSHLGEAAQTGVIDLATLGITGRQVDLVKPKAEAEDKRESAAAVSGTSFHMILFEVIRTLAVKVTAQGPMKLKTSSSMLVSHVPAFCSTVSL
ncbi:phosphoinositide 3-kinase regulatory subunit 4-like [Morone saxatilis]|uniref:phosphoinositide 3-kinase regulatory subunit 4-like n=1 Tax=Morone saxatilis TaxID=34816 RepID=UPI0015E23E52|nr:phosphoinositide 3-kinase regulatory subunit 4-like [Morone saxatilis]